MGASDKYYNIKSKILVNNFFYFNEILYFIDFLKKNLFKIIIENKKRGKTMITRKSRDEIKKMEAQL